MKISNMALLFVVIILPFVVRNVVCGESLEQKAYNKVWLDQIVNVAVDDGIDELMIRGNNNYGIINKEASVHAFMETLYLNFGAIHSPQRQGMIDLYVPVFVVMDYDGFYVWSLEAYKDDSGYNNTVHIWSEKRPYTWESQGLIYGFTMDDWLSVYDMQSEETYEENYQILSGTVDGFLLSDYADFQWKRQETITNLVEAAIRADMNEHNVIASRYGITYDFNLPILEDDTWNQCIGDIGILTFVQGIPMGMAGEYYNQYSIGGASLYKASPYYIEADTATGIPYYHQEGCSHITENSQPCISMREAAKEGALPCEDCMP